MKIGFLGCGNMGSAIARALMSGTAHKVSVYSKGESAAKFARASQGKAVLYSSLNELIEKNDAVVIAVKPQTLRNMWDELRKSGSAGTKWISLAAGVNLRTLEEELGTADVVRFMPNIAAKTGSSVTAVASAPQCSKTFCAEAFEIAKSFGSAFELPEDKFSAFIGVSASAIAYIFRFAHALGMGGQIEGLTYRQSVEMAFDTMKSAFDVYKTSDLNVQALEESVCSKGGTTIEGIKVLRDNNFDIIVSRAVSAAAARSREMENTEGSK